MKIHYSPSPTETRTLDTEQLRERFLIDDLFGPGKLVAHYTDLDRMILGGASPQGKPLVLPDCKETGTDFFLERRELGVINLGAPGTVRAGGKEFSLGTHDCLYVGRGTRDVAFEGNGSQFYFVSTPAHADHPTALAKRADVQGDELGDAASANRRRIVKYIHAGGIKSCQLVMGFTEFEPGSVWNTMPPHTHGRRSEAYLYFDLADRAVVHLMGEPCATRHLVVRDREAVLSPPWSIHCGAGTGSYRFVWAMGGDNQTFSDMDPAPLSDLK